MHGTGRVKSCSYWYSRCPDLLTWGTSETVAHISKLFQISWSLVTNKSQIGNNRDNASKPSYLILVTITLVNVEFERFFELTWSRDHEFNIWHSPVMWISTNLLSVVQILRDKAYMVNWNYTIFWISWPFANHIAQSKLLHISNVSCIMLNNCQTYFKNLVVFTTQDFQSMFDLFQHYTWNRKTTAFNDAEL